MSFSETLIISLVSGGIGFFLGLLTHNLNVKRENISTTRERLLKNIVKVEDFVDLIVEFSYIGNSICEIDEALSIIKSSCDVIRDEQSKINDEQEFIGKELQKITDHEQIEFYNSRLEHLHDRLVNIQGELEKNELYLKLKSGELDEIREMNNKHKKRIMSDDIITTAYLIDRSGNLHDSINRLMDIYSNPSSNSVYGIKVLELRRKINEILNNKIMGIS